MAVKAVPFGAAFFVYGYQNFVYRQKPCKAFFNHKQGVCLRQTPCYDVVLTSRRLVLAAHHFYGHFCFDLFVEVNHRSVFAS